MIAGLLDVLFGCRHNNYTMPHAMPQPSPIKHYVCCLGCGKEFGYCWQMMKVLGPVTRPIEYAPEKYQGDSLARIENAVDEVLAEA